MDVKDFHYELPKELIAQEPIEDRTNSRLMVLDKRDGSIEHRIFKDITDYLKQGDCLVLNDTKVMPARLFGVRTDTGGEIEFVLLKRLLGNTWEVLVRPGKRAKKGTVFSFGDKMMMATILDTTEAGGRIADFTYDGIFEEILDKIGQMPTPPYIKKRLVNQSRYQTVYARHFGSAAAPTAGLHFTKDLLSKIEDIGVKTVYITLHVGLGTFRPVKSERVETHVMHEEYYEISARAAQDINTARDNGGRVISVGTTSTRTLETAADDNGRICPSQGWSNIFIYPGYKFKIIDGIITNFHLPESTLIMLVSAFAGKDNILNAYRHAILQKYRFFSFGDAMFIK